MKLDEETFLTALLDGELAPEHRRRVESELLTDPALADDLRALTAVRDLVAGLPRPPAPAELSDLVVARIARRRATGPFGLRLVPASAGWPGRAAALLTAAAALVLLASPPPQKVLERRPAAGPGPVVVRPDLVRAPAVPVKAGVGSVVAEAVESSPDASERRREAERRLVRNLLDSPNVRPALIVTDVIGGDAGRQVGEILDTLPRRNPAFGRITVPQGIIFDPDHPGVAMFFAAVMDDREYRQFQDRLTRRFPDAVEVAEPPPELLTRLSNVDQLAVLSGKPVADLIDPASAERVRALRSAPGKPDMTKTTIYHDHAGPDPLRDQEHPVVEADPSGTQAGPTPEQERSGPHPSLRTLPRASQPVVPARPEPPPSPVVLVYVTTAHKHRAR